MEYSEMTDMTGLLKDGDDDGERVYVGCMAELTQAKKL